MKYKTLYIICVTKDKRYTTHRATTEWFQHVIEDFISRTGEIVLFKTHQIKLKRFFNKLESRKILLEVGPD